MIESLPYRTMPAQIVAIARHQIRVSALRLAIANNDRHRVNIQAVLFVSPNPTIAHVTSRSARPARLETMGT
jgi:hypothetical protein